MSPKDLVSKEEIEASIPTDRVEGWLQSLFSRYDGNEEEKQYLRLKRGITKELVDELHPLSKYCKHYYNSPEYLLQYYSGSEKSYDADIVDIEGNLVERIEVTISIDGQRERINSETLNQYGHAPLYKTAEYTGSARNRDLVEPDAFTISSSEIILEESKRLQEVYDHKHGKIDKYPNTTLLIGINLPLMCLKFEYQGVVENFHIHEGTFDKIRCVDVSSDQYWSFK